MFHTLPHKLPAQRISERRKFWSEDPAAKLAGTTPMGWHSLHEYAAAAAARWPGRVPDCLIIATIGIEGRAMMMSDYRRLRAIEDECAAEGYPMPTDFFPEE